MICTQAEAGGVEAVQPPDTPPKGAALHPEERLFRQSLRRDFSRLLQNRFPDGAGVVGIPGAEQHGAAVHGLEAAAEGGIDDAFLVEPKIQLRGFAEQRFCRIKKIKIGTVLDLVSLGFLIGQSIGRWGNFINREAFGAATDSFFRMGLYNTVTGAWEYYHPTFLYESVWNAVGFVLLHVLSKHRKYDGEIALGYVAWYGLGRCLIEGLRMDSLYWGSVRVSQLLAGVSCAAAVCILIWQRFRPHDKAELFVNQVAARAAENAAQTQENETKE